MQRGNATTACSNWVRSTIDEATQGTFERCPVAQRSAFFLKSTSALRSDRPKQPRSDFATLFSLHACHVRLVNGYLHCVRGKTPQAARAGRVNRKAERPPGGNGLGRFIPLGCGFSFPTRTHRASGATNT